MTTSQQWTGFDIETKPRTDLVERFAKPFPDFDASAVKCGNLKDPVKIAEKMAQAKADHEGDRVAYWKTQKERASLNPFTGEILVIGLIDQDANYTYLEGPEADILRAFWTAYSLSGDAGRKWVFWSGCGSGSKMFDLDYIVTRSRILGVSIPPGVRSGRFYGGRFVDLASEFLLYGNDGYLSLSKAADIFGLYVDDGHTPGPEGAPADLTIFPKRDDDPVRGENFWQWYTGTAQPDEPSLQQRLFALRYLRNDLLHLYHLAPRIL